MTKQKILDIPAQMKKTVFLLAACASSFLFMYPKSVLAVEQTGLFVSLGSTCLPANFKKFCGLRTASFPFDWILSLDEEVFIEILEDDFSHFFNMEYNVLASENVLLNTYYHLEFLHEGNWSTQYLSTIENFINRYKRRIARFRNLKNFPGKVFFIRATDHTPKAHRFFRGNENISEEQSLCLYNTLKKYFPNLDFTLIVLNFKEDKKQYVVEKELSDNLLIISGPHVRLPDDDSLCNIFHRLLGERSLMKLLP